jgi:hypothetical protein
MRNAVLVLGRLLSIREVICYYYAYRSPSWMWSAVQFLKRVICSSDTSILSVDVIWVPKLLSAVAYS